MTEFFILLLRLSKEPFLLALLFLLILLIIVALALLAVFLQGRKSRTSIKAHFTCDITIEF